MKTDLSTKQYRVGDVRITSFAYISFEGDIRFRCIAKYVDAGIGIFDTLHHHTRDQAHTAMGDGLKKLSEGLLAAKKEMEVGREEE